MLEIITLYYRWWKTWKRFPVTSWIRGASLYRKGSYAAAESSYRSGLNSHPDHPARFSARLDLAYCLFKQRKLVEAEEQLRFVATHAPALREVHLRLARLQLWAGHSLDAAWTMRRAVQKVGADADLVATFIFAVIENGGPTYLLKEAEGHSEGLSSEERATPLMRTALAKLAICNGQIEYGTETLRDIAARDNAPFEAVILFAEALLEQGDIVGARQELKRAMTVSADHPKLLSLLADSYLKSGELYNPDFAKQLAISACQSSQWSSPRDMHILAEAYFHIGDKMAALIVASKAKQAGSRLLGSYRGVKNLERLIETLSSGTQA